MSGWHNVEIFALSPWGRSEYYVLVSTNWQDEFYCGRMLIVLTPPVFAYYSEAVLRYDCGAPAIWSIAITEYVVMAFLRMLGAAHDGAVGVACIDL